MDGDGKIAFNDKIPTLAHLLKCTQMLWHIAEFECCGLAFDSFLSAVYTKGLICGGRETHAKGRGSVH